MGNKDIELVCILDKSGSMMGLEKDTIGGFNSLLEKQKGEKGEARVTTVLFDHRYTMLHNRLPIQEVKPLTKEDYSPEGSTALLDAVGRTIDLLLEHHGTLQKEQKPSVMFVIITDGEENSSQDYTLEKIRKRIGFCKENEGWEFIYLGANVDAFAAASDLGIGKTRTASYHADSVGISVNFKVLNSAMSQMRACKVVNDDWKKGIEEDYNKRGK